MGVLEEQRAELARRNHGGTKSAVSESYAAEKAVANRKAAMPNRRKVPLERAAAAVDSGGPIARAKRWMKGQNKQFTDIFNSKTDKINEY